MLKKLGWTGAAIVVAGCPVVALSQNTDSVSQQLTGRWEGLIKPLDVPMGIQFSPTGRFILVFDSLGSLSRSAFAVKYSINSTSKPMELNLSLEKPITEKDKQPVLTIFELSSSRTMRLQIKNLEPGKPQPTRFEEPAELSKVSDSAIAFPGADQLTQAEQSKDGEGRLVMRNLATSSLYYSMEMQQFPTKLSQLGLSNDSTQNYRYQLQSKSEGIALIARPRKENLKSYIAVVLRYPVREQDNTTTILCESVRPARIAPPMPQLLKPAYEADQIRCGSGSQAIGFKE